MKGRRVVRFHPIPSAPPRRDDRNRDTTMTKYILVDGEGERVEDCYGADEQPFDTYEKAEQYLPWAEQTISILNPVTVEEVEQSDETTEETSNVSDNTYDFIGSDDDQSDEQSDVDDKWNWEFGDHTTATGGETNPLSEALGKTMGELDSEVDQEMMAVLEDAQDLVQSTSISRYECSHSECGLGHSHPDWKHDICASPDASQIRSNIPGFNVSPAFAEGMKFIANCHCGANEAAMLVQFFPYFTTEMFKDEDRFRGVLEVKPDVLDGMYRLYNEDDASVSRAAARAAKRRNADESELVPLGVRDDIKAFFERRQQMERQASKAPISQETRQAIEEAREELEEVTSQ